jgi:hypothetical protein
MGKMAVGGDELPIMLCKRECAWVCPTLKKWQGMGVDIELFTVKPWH